MGTLSDVIDAANARMDRNRRERLAAQIAVAAIAAGGWETATICAKAIEIADALIAELDKQ